MRADPTGAPPALRWGSVLQETGDQLRGWLDDLSPYPHELADAGDRDRATRIVDLADQLRDTLDAELTTVDTVDAALQLLLDALRAPDPHQPFDATARSLVADPRLSDWTTRTAPLLHPAAAPTSARPDRPLEWAGVLQRSTGSLRNWLADLGPYPHLLADTGHLDHATAIASRAEQLWAALDAEHRTLTSVDATLGALLDALRAAATATSGQSAVAAGAWCSDLRVRAWRHTTSHLTPTPRPMSDPPGVTADGSDPSPLGRWPS